MKRLLRWYWRSVRWFRRLHMEATVEKWWFDDARQLRAANAFLDADYEYHRRCRKAKVAS